MPDHHQKPLVSPHHNLHRRALHPPPSSPRPQTPPKTPPPIWLGGTGEKHMLKLVAEQADVWNTVNHSGLAEATRLSKVLDTWCTKAGRNPTEIRRSVQLRPTPTASSTT
ncbi:LLM class flavin-dependent oxidoreductase [Catenulispora yoronensis]